MTRTARPRPARRGLHLPELSWVAALGLLATACAETGVPDPKVAADAYARAATKGDGDAIYAMMTTRAQKQRSREEVRAIVERRADGARPGGARSLGQGRPRRGDGPPPLRRRRGDRARFARRKVRRHRRRRPSGRRANARGGARPAPPGPRAAQLRGPHAGPLASDARGHRAGPPDARRWARSPGDAPGHDRRATRRHRRCPRRAPCATEARERRVEGRRL